MSIDQGNGPRLQHRHSSVQHAKTLLIRKLLQRLNTANRQKGYPRLACLVGDHMSEEIIVSGLYEEGLLRAVFDGLLKDSAEEFRNTIALDIGANIGNHSCFFAGRFKEVWAFEPNPTALALLNANLLINNSRNVRVFPFGLSDAPAELPFAQNEAGNLGASRFVAEQDDRATTKLVVKTGDTVIEDQIEDRVISLVKVDVEGHELAALKGLERTLAKHRPIILFEALGEAEGSAVITFLQSVGYSDFFAVEKKRSSAKNPLIRKIKRAVGGMSFYSNRIEKLEDRYYCMIVAVAR